MSGETQNTAPAQSVQREDGRAGVLENMSARPRTPIVRNIPALRPDWTVFTVDLTELTSGQLKVSGALAAELDERWAKLGFTGAALLRPLGPLEAAGVHPLPCPDRLLTLNILLRARGRLLLEGTPLLESLRGDELVAVASDDPLLVAATHTHHEPASTSAADLGAAGDTGVPDSEEQTRTDPGSAADSAPDVQHERRAGGIRRFTNIGRGGAR
jgi:hypothetical protein